MKGRKYVVRDGKLIDKCLVDAFSIQANEGWENLGEQLGQMIRDTYLKDRSREYMVGPDLLGLKP